MEGQGRLWLEFLHMCVVYMSNVSINMMSLTNAQIMLDKMLKRIMAISIVELRYLLRS
jgi:hypothetical protein